MSKKYRYNYDGFSEDHTGTHTLCSSIVSHCTDSDSEMGESTFDGYSLNRPPAQPPKKKTRGGEVVALVD